MNFQQLLYGAEVLSHRGNPDVSGIEYDSRRVKRGDAFVAMRESPATGINSSIRQSPLEPSLLSPILRPNNRATELPGRRFYMDDARSRG
jgi:hypothetical protein